MTWSDLRVLGLTSSNSLSVPVEAREPGREVREL